MDDRNKLEYANNLIECSLLPELVNELGDSYIEPKHFDEFRTALDAQLTRLFDYIQQNEDVIFESDMESREIRRNFILLLCEQTAPCTLYHTNNQKLLEHFHYLVKIYFTRILNNDSSLEAAIFNYYKDKLKPGIWKKQLGATHGFIQFLKLRYNTTDIILPSDMGTFVLSVGLLLNEFYEPALKELSYEIFNMLLKNSKESLISNLNIHNVVYNAVLLDVAKIDSAEGTKQLWECILKCVVFMEPFDFSKWNKLDDSIEIAMRRITFAPNSDVRCILFITISKLCVNFSDNREEIAPFWNFDSLGVISNNVNDLRNVCKEITSLVSYKWAKKILHLLIAESQSLLGSWKTSCQLFWAMHVCYLVCIFPISINILEPLMIEFLRKFVAVLVDVMRLHKAEDGVIQDVRVFLQSILFHVEKLPSKDEKIISYVTALQKLLLENFL